MADIHGITSLADGASKLQTVIGTALGNVNLSGTGAPNQEVLTGMLQFLDAKNFNTHNTQSGIVQAEAEYKAYNGADADNPPVGSTQTAHYGWEIYRDGTRVAGPAHVFFVATVILPFYRRPGIELKEESSLRLTKEGVIGTGKISSVTKYFKYVS